MCHRWARIPGRPSAVCAHACVDLQKINSCDWHEALDAPQLNAPVVSAWFSRRVIEVPVTTGQLPGDLQLEVRL